MFVVYGGAFNPPTIAHYRIAAYILDTLKCEKLIYLPVGDQYHKKGLVQASHRVKMLNLLAQKLHRASVSTLEVDHENVLTTYESLRLLQQQYPNETLAFVIGADNLKDLPSWSHVTKLITNFKLVVLRRAQLDVDALISAHFKGLESQFIVLDGFEALDISSTMYRENKQCNGICLPEVDEYVHQFKLYGRGE